MTLILAAIDAFKTNRDLDLGDVYIVTGLLDVIIVLAVLS